MYLLVVFNGKDIDRETTFSVSFLAPPWPHHPPFLQEVTDGRRPDNQRFIFVGTVLVHCSEAGRIPGCGAADRPRAYDAPRRGGVLRRRAVQSRPRKQCRTNSGSRKVVKRYLLVVFNDKDIVAK